MTAFALSTWACGGRAEQHALLVGVSHYAAFALDDRMQLSGPRNDVPLMRALLERRGFASEAVQVLADGVPGAAAPTRAAILGALDRLVERAKEGDFVFLYFAGHGSQMPADPQTPQGRAESDGLHEIFLPADVGRWNASTGRVDNAIADHELVSRLDALLARQAFVWAVFDACHSATLMRGAGDRDIRYRHVDPSALGIPQAALSRLMAGAGKPEIADSAPGTVRVQADRKRSPASGRGNFVAFYAAQTTQTTPELRLPAGDPDRRTYGLFSFTLAEALSATAGATYRQLAQHVLARYRAQNIQTPTPLFNGSGLDAPLFGSQVGQPVRQWPVRATRQGVTLPAGLLDQLQVGTELTILPGPLAADAARLGTMRVAAADLMTSRLAPVPATGKPIFDIGRMPPQAVARLQGPLRPAFRLRVVAPAAALSSDADAVREAIAAMRRDVHDGVELVWVDAVEPHDLRLLIDDGQLWLLPPSGQWYKTGPHKTHSIRLGQPGFRARLSDSLQRIGRAQNLWRMASALAEVSATPMLRVEGRIESATGGSRGLDPLEATPAGEGDTVRLEVRNAGRVAVDLTVLYLDAGYGITALYPHPRGTSNRIEPGASVTAVAHVNVDSTGHERILLIGVVARDQGESRDFSFLAQDQVERTRSAERDGIVRLFEEAGFGGERATTARATPPLATPERAEMHVFTLQVR